ncbi:MAG TPA: AsnC family protein [Candidatus Competibacteraceae bacterium]|nr:AsnC family protein [Candidatus Competibacteraceae bacterium]
MNTLGVEDRALIALLQEGLPLCPHPYALLAERLGWDEAAVRAAIARLQADGVIRRFGVVVRHHELGYRANAMVVWDVPDAEVDAVGERLARWPGVNLCYRRTRRPPRWPYNLFCMLHGRERAEVEARIAELRRALDLERYPYAVLFSLRRHQQRGARFAGLPPREVAHG